MIRCRRCHRELKNPLSIKRGIGSTCYAKDHKSISKLTGHEWEQVGLFQGGFMAHDDIPEDRQQSYPCECGGNITKKGIVWECDTCDCSYLDKDA